MTPEQLERAIEAGNQDEVIRLIAAASEADRRRAAPTVVRLKADLFRRYMYDHTSDYAKKEARFQQQDEAAALAILGTCTLDELKQLRGHDGREETVPRRAFEILSARRPGWLIAWAEWKLEDGCPWVSLWRTSPWLVVRRLIRAGLIARPSSDGYIVSMIRCYQPSAQDRWAEIRAKDPQVRHAPDRLHTDALHQILRSDPEVLDDEVWRLFEVEGIGPVSLASDGTTWQTVLMELCAAGRLDRQRLLASSLQALQRDCSPFHAGWFARFHEALKPTPDERAERMETYLALIGSAVPATVSFALKVLAAVDKGGRLPAERIVTAVGPALAAREKGTAALALRLLDRAARRNETLRSEVALVACEALEHSASDVQRQAIDLLEALEAMADPAVRMAVEQRAQAVSPSLQSRVAALLRRQDGVETVDSEEANQNADLERLLQRAEQIDPALARQAGVVEALRAVRLCGTAFTRLALPFRETPRLAPSRRQVPVTNLDDLIDLFASVLEHEGPADDIERVLDGVSCLCGERPSDFERRTSALRKRAETLLGGWIDAPFSGNGVRYDLCGLALAWTTGTIHGGASLLRPDGWWNRLPLFVSARVMEIARNAAARRPRSLLAAPTHAGGWIDPVVAVERLRERVDVGSLPDRTLRLYGDTIPGWREAPDVCDIIQALLRLAPDRRAEALRLAYDLRGEPGAAFRYAFGADDVSIGSLMPLWIAAARARAPLEDDERVERRFPRLGPGTGRAGRVNISWQPNKNSIYGYGEISYDLPMPNVPRFDLPTTLHFSSIKDDLSWRLRTAEDNRWLMEIWPQCRYPLWIAGTLSFGRNLGGTQTIRGDVVILELLADPDEPVTEPAADLLAVALAAKEPMQSTAATDVLIAAISDTRLDSATLGQAMTAALQIEPLKPQRWAKTLTEAGRASLLHAFVIHEAIERVLSSGPQRAPQQMIGLFELLVELAAQTGMGITAPQARSYLGSIAGGGKAARLAQTLLGLSVSCSKVRARSVAAQILTSRIERAERWQRAAAVYGAP